LIYNYSKSIKDYCYDMRILIYSGFCNGLGDLNFGKKVANLVQEKYPDAEIVLLTSSSSKFRTSTDGLTEIDKFNNASDRKFTCYDDYLKQGGSEADLLIAGPTLNFDANIISQLAPSTSAPIVLMSEYNFDVHMPDLTEDLTRAGYENISQMPTGLGNDSRGIFIDKKLTQLNRADIRESSFFTEELPQTGKTLLGSASPSQYLDLTNITVSYSHNNAERFLTVHGMVTQPERDADVIVMGEEAGEKRKDLPVLQNIAPMLLEKGFGKVIYQELGCEPKVIAENESGGPTYRVIHTGRLSPEESSNLRLIGGPFSGATGDQSYSEAIATSSMIVYECQPWKKGLVDQMEAISKEVDPEGELSRALHLLAFAKTMDEYKELSCLLSQPKIQEDFKLFQKKILQEHNFTQNLQMGLEELVSKVSFEQKATKPNLITSIGGRILNFLIELISKVRSSKDTPKIDNSLALSASRTASSSNTSSTATMMLQIGPHSDTRKPISQREQQESNSATEKHDVTKSTKKTSEANPSSTEEKTTNEEDQPRFTP
jgi:hypothetical protein